MVVGTKSEASIDNVHVRTELLLFCSSSTPHNRFLTFFDIRTAFCPEHAYRSPHICPISLILRTRVQREEHFVSSTGVDRSVPNQGTKESLGENLSWKEWGLSGVFWLRSNWKKYIRGHVWKWQIFFLFAYFRNIFPQEKFSRTCFRY